VVLVTVCLGAKILYRGAKTLCSWWQYNLVKSSKQPEHRAMVFIAPLKMTWLALSDGIHMPAS